MMKNYYVWGEYGPVASMTISYVLRAKNEENARKRGIALLKKSGVWDRIGERNVYVREGTS